jgi:RNA polymerase sigma-70 factor
VRLFVARDERAAAITSYGGRGPLRRWFRMVATRTLLNLLTRGVAETPASDDFLADMLGGEGDPELEYIKHGYRREFERAFKACLASLDEEAQMLLRAAFRDGLTVDALAAIHTARTAPPWRAGCARLMADLGMNESELDSMFNLILRRMEVTLNERVRS